MDRVFLDANVLFSAAYRPGAGLLQLWDLEDIELITSTYALEEARLNLETPEQHSRLKRLVSTLRIFDRQTDFYLTEAMDLPEKDRPILMAAIESKATHLLTGDIRPFGSYYGQRVKGIFILPPADYLRAKLTRRKAPDGC